MTNNLQVLELPYYQRKELCQRLQKMNWSNKSRMVSLFLVKLPYFIALCRKQDIPLSLVKGLDRWRNGIRIVSGISRKSRKWLPIIGLPNALPPEEPFITATMKEVDERISAVIFCAWLYQTVVSHGLSISIYPSFAEISRSILDGSIFRL